MRLGISLGDFVTQISTAYCTGNRCQRLAIAAANSTADQATHDRSDTHSDRAVGRTSVCLLICRWWRISWRRVVLGILRLRSRPRSRMLYIVVVNNRLVLNDFSDRRWSGWLLLCLDRNQYLLLRRAC